MWKVIALVTDNGSNFIKAFESFGIEIKCISEITAFDNCEGEENDEVIKEEIQDREDLVRELNLPRHSRCASHTLALVCSAASEKVSYAGEFSTRAHALALCLFQMNDKRMAHSAFGKCSAL